LLRSVYVLRVCVALAIYLTAALKVRVAAPLDILVTSVLLLVTLVVTAASYVHTHVRGRQLNATFLYLQAVYDVALVTTVVHMTGGPDSDLTGLYVLLIAATALLMPPTSTALVTALAGLAYLADVLFSQGTIVGMGSGGKRGVQQAQQAMRQGGHGFPMPGKKRKKGGPWGLIKAR
jgi:hypothetical protein